MGHRRTARRAAARRARRPDPRAGRGGTGAAAAHPATGPLGRRRTPGLRGVRRPGPTRGSSRARSPTCTTCSTSTWSRSARAGPAGSTATSPRIYCVCTHGKHDTCCAERGRPAAAALEAAHRDHTWEVSHIGGDRFAGNMLVLPHGLYYGRIDAVTALAVAGAHGAGELDLDHLRGRSGLPTAAQYAEVALRRDLAETRNDSVRFVSREVHGDADRGGLRGRRTPLRRAGAHPARPRRAADLQRAARQPDPGARAGRRRRIVVSERWPPWRTPSSSPTGASGG